MLEYIECGIIVILPYCIFRSGQSSVVVNEEKKNVSVINTVLKGFVSDITKYYDVIR